MLALALARLRGARTARRTCGAHDEGDRAGMKRERGVTLPYLRAWRRRRAMSQGELVQRVDLARSTVARAETGSEIVSFPNIRKLADALGITPEQLMRVDPDAEMKS
jgi:ribosome-binding protein aMBF1 (putative translation factor)